MDTRLGLPKCVYRREMDYPITRSTKEANSVATLIPLKATLEMDIDEMIRQIDDIFVGECHGAGLGEDVFAKLRDNDIDPYEELQNPSSINNEADYHNVVDSNRICCITCHSATAWHNGESVNHGHVEI